MHNNLRGGGHRGDKIQNGVGSRARYSVDRITDLFFKVEEEIGIEADVIGCDVHATLHQNVSLQGT